MLDFPALSNHRLCTRFIRCESVMIADKAAPEAVGSDAGHSVLDGFISEQEYARQRGVSLRTCQRERALRKSAPYVLLGKKVFYRVATVRAWLLAQQRTL